MKKRIAVVLLSLLFAVSSLAPADTGTEMTGQADFNNAQSTPYETNDEAFDGHGENELPGSDRNNAGTLEEVLPVLSDTDEISGSDAAAAEGDWGNYTDEEGKSVKQEVLNVLEETAADISENESIRENSAEGAEDIIFEEIMSEAVTAEEIYTESADDITAEKSDTDIPNVSEEGDTGTADQDTVIKGKDRADEYTEENEPETGEAVTAEIEKEEKESAEAENEEENIIETEIETGNAKEPESEKTPETETEEETSEYEEDLSEEFSEDGTDEGTQEESEEQEEELKELDIDGAGNSFATATSISTGRNYSGSITASNTSDFYIFSISSSGTVNYTASAAINYVYYSLYDSAGNRMWRVNPSWNSTTHLSNTNTNWYLTKGTYYIVVEKDGNRYGNYNFNISFSSAQESFAEAGNGTNNSMDTANSVSIGKTYKGQLSMNDDRDFYKFTLGKSGRLHLDAYAGISYIYYRLYNAQGNQVWSANPNWNSTSQMSTTNTDFDLLSGTYYFVVQRDGSRYGNYNFTLSFSSANESFTESLTSTNDSMNTAHSVSGGTLYNGQLAMNESKDFYKFTMSSAGQLDIEFTAKYMSYVYYYVYDENGKELLKKNPNWNSNTQAITSNASISLSRGTYYFCVAKDGSRTGIFTFKLNGAKKTSTPITLKAVTGLKARTVGQKKITLTWNKVSNATGYFIIRLNAANKGGTQIGYTTGTSYTDSSAYGGGYNFYWVMPFYKNESGNIVKGPVGTYVYAFGGYISKIKNVRVTNSGNALRISWSGDAGANSYVIMSKTGSSKAAFNKNITVNGTSYTDRNISAGQIKYYWVYGIYRDGNGKIMAAGPVSDYSWGKLQ